MILVEGLNYEVQNLKILNNININIKANEKIALIGPSGAGKSSLLKVLSNRIDQYQGRITLNNIPIDTIKSNKVLAQNIGIINQQFDLIEASTVRKNVLAGKLKDWSFIDSIHHMFFRKDDISPILKHVRLSQKENEYVHVLSGGEKQRVAIARIIMQDPQIILADEPVASLDPSLSESILVLLIEKARDKTLIVSLHQQELALKHFDRIIGLKNGSVFFDLSKEMITTELLEQLYG